MTPTPAKALRTIGPYGHIHWQGRSYGAAFAHARIGERITVEHGAHSEQIEVRDPATGHHLGTAHALPTPPPPAHPAPASGAASMTTTPTPAPADDDSGQGPDFYLDLPDARIVATEALLEASENIADTINARAMSCIYGDAGLGKTFSVRAALKEVAADLVLLLQFRSRPTPRDIRRELFDVLHLEGKAPAHPSEFDQLLKRALVRRPYIIVCDEAQQFSRECFEFVRHLYDTGKGKTRPAVLFVGGEECYKTLYNEPALASRIYIWQEFTPMEPEEVAKNIPLFHPVWANASPELINFIDLEAGGGTFRMWSKITHHVLEGMRRRGLSEVDETLARWALRRSRPIRRDDDR
ncbi:AAA family ATPase [Streptomyces murinus]|uniref:AAA family ATPase n=1 Tax=Streptomyces murinus TaxID=33900 RepID=UPI00380BBAF6